ncbi:jg11919 [Pararge aegeria aegeria]|uniref:Jg11919 protein n=1 Tax=Pararge aegeria aegeria TaxID=348720 RepID=A0A8S4SD28_9NEOP|nr:jg11919 [Pararge aegeria aegeria]
MGLIRRVAGSETIKRTILGIFLRDQIRNDENHRTRDTDIAQRRSRSGRQWAGHIARRPDGSWGTKVVESAAINAALIDP